MRFKNKCQLGGLLKHKPTKLLPRFHMRDSSISFPHNKKITCQHTFSYPACSDSPIPLACSEQEFTAAFLKCSETTFLVTQCSRPGKWVQLKTNLFSHWLVFRCRVQAALVKSENNEVNKASVRWAGVEQAELLPAAVPGSPELQLLL